MGNSQSMDKVQHVVKEGIKIYKTVKKEQDQQQHQPNNNDQQQYNNHTSSSNHSSSNYHPSADIDDDEEYASLRAQAHEEAEKRNACYAQSQEAYNNGDGARGKYVIYLFHCSHAD